MLPCLRDPALHQRFSKQDCCISQMGALRGSFRAANRSVPSTFLLYMYSAEESTAPSAFKEAEKKYQRHVQQISRKRYSADPKFAMHKRRSDRKSG